MMDRQVDESFMRLAIREAKKGQWKTSPNPCVGAVIVRGREIISRGYHQKSGEPHAEVNAIRNAKESVQGCTIYVTLEPCNHTGKTPPCTHAILEAGLSRVVIGMVDPNPVVHGSGIEFLKEKGILVTSGLLAEECTELNYPFIKHITTGLPWIVMKAGISLDGKLNYQKGESGWITGPESVRYVHRLRDRFDAIMIGRNTAEIDNPSLTTRLQHRKGRDPVRIILDSELRLEPQAKIFTNDSSAPTWIFCANSVAAGEVKRLEKKDRVRVFQVQKQNGRLNLQQIMQQIGGEGICSVLVEGGAQLHGTLLNHKLFDYAYLFMAPIFAGECGISLIDGLRVKNKTMAPSIQDAKWVKMGTDRLIHGKIVYSSHLLT